jgi:hypothetical protein
MKTTHLTVRSVNGAKLTTATPKLFVVDNIGTIEDALNVISTQTVTEAGDTAAQMSLWAIYGTGAKLFWKLTLNGAGHNEVKIYADQYGNNLVASGNTDGDGIVNCLPVNDSGIYVQVTVAYTADDADAANTIQLTNWDAMTDIQIPGITQFDYKEADGHTNIYTVDEAKAAIRLAIDSSTTSVSVATGALTVANITILNGTPIVALATPGAGHAIQILGGEISYTYGVAAYSVNTTVDIINTTTGTILAQAATAVAGTASKITRIIPIAGLLIANEGLSLKINSGNPTVGAGATGTCTYKILYSIIHI